MRFRELLKKHDAYFKAWERRNLLEGDCRAVSLSEQGHALRTVLNEAWKGGFSLQGDFFRKHAEVVCMAASLNLISTRESANLYGRRWRITSKGLRWLNEQFLENT
jgi:hypothetical protein